MRGCSPLRCPGAKLRRARNSRATSVGNDRRGVALKSGYKTAMRTANQLEGCDFDDDGAAFAFAALGQPSGETFRKTCGGEAIAGFDAAVGKGKSVVKIGGIGEIAHAELVEPVEGAGPFVALDDDLDRELLRVHASILAR